MAKTKGKGLIYRLTMGRDDLPDFTPSKLPGSRWAQFKDIFRNRFGALVKINLLVLLFALPAIAWYVIVSLMKQVDGAMVPYSSNIGVGYPVVTDAALIGQYRAFSFEIQRWLIMIPLLVIAGIGLAGGFYVIRRLVWDQGIAVGGDFFRGIKYNFLPFLWSSLFMGISLFLVMFNIHAYNNFTDIHVAWKIVGIAVSVIQFILIMFMMMFLTTQAVTYKLKIWGLIKNSFLFAIALVPQNLFFLAISIIPIVLMLVLPTMFSIFIVMIYAFIGFSYLILVWTLYAHSMFDRFINDKIEGAKNRGIYKRTPEEIERDRAEKAERDRKNRNIRFNNPKKKKKVSSIDEGSTFEPLPTTFSRADLARLQEQKEAVKREIDAEYDDIEGADEDDEAGADDDFYTGGETGTPAEGTEAPGASGTEDDAPADGDADGKSE